MENNLTEKLKAIEGKELKYKQLCKELDLPVKTSNGKKAQFNELAVYCNIELLENPKRYIITEVYEEAFEILKLLSSNNKYQIMFDAALYQAFLDNNGEPIFLSHMDTLELFKEVNDNFSYACNKDCIMLIDEQYDYMPEIGLAIYRILNQWTQRRLKSMENRGAIRITNCYRLYKKIQFDEFEYMEKFNPPIGSDMDKICQDIYRQAIDEIMPEHWGEVEKGGKFWVPEKKWKKFQDRIKELTKERFNDNYDDLKPIIKIECPATEWLKEKVSSLCKELNALTEINEESCRKALETKSKKLDEITQGQRKEFIEINMRPNPPFMFRDKLKEINLK